MMKVMPKSRRELPNLGSSSAQPQPSLVILKSFPISGSLVIFCSHARSKILDNYYI